MEDNAQAAHTPARKFKGVWICAAIWQHPLLTWLQKCVAAEIDALSDEHEACTASDEYLGKMFDVTARRMANIISELCVAGVVERVKSGRSRGLRLSHAFREGQLVTVKAEITETVKPLIEGGTRSVVVNTGAAIVRELTDAWCVAYKRAHGRDYVFAGSKDAQAAKRLLDTGLTVIQLLDIAKAAWAAQDQRGKFWSKHAASISGFAARFNDIRNELQPANGAATHTEESWSLEALQKRIYSEPPTEIKAKQ